MDYMALVPYFIASTIFLVAPGPLMAVLIARSLARDGSGATAFAGGLCVGSLLIICAVAMGLGFWAEGRPELLSLAKYVGVSYLLWLAVGMWNDRSGPASATRGKESGFASACAGAMLCVGNPSVLLFYMLMLPSVAPDGIGNVEQAALVVLVTCASAVIVFFGTVLLARQFNRLLSSRGSSTTFSRIAAAMTALTSVWILAA